jgi:hypothetical protein
MSGTKRLRLVVALVFAGPELGGATAQAVRVLDLSPFAVRYPTVIHLAAEGR